MDGRLFLRHDIDEDGHELLPELSCPYIIAGVYLPGKNHVLLNFKIGISYCDTLVSLVIWRQGVQGADGTDRL